MSEIELRPYKAVDALDILENQPKQPGLTKEVYVLEWAKVKEDRGPAITVLAEEKVIGCGGLEMLWPGVGEGWCLFVNNIDRYGLSVGKAIKRCFMDMTSQAQLHRCQAILRVDYAAGIKMATWLDFKREGILRQYFPDKTDAYMYARLWPIYERD